MSNYLKETYNVTKEFTCGYDFIRDHSLEINRYFNNRNFTTIKTNNNNQSSFYYRLSIERSKSFSINERMEKKKFKGRKNVLYFNLTRDVKVVEVNQ